MRYAWALLLALLIACEPPAPPPAPTPDPPPVVIGDELEGAWYGVMSSDQNFFVHLNLLLELDEVAFTGTAEFPDEPMLAVGSVYGVPEALTITVADEGVTVTFVLEGAVEGEAYVGAIENLLGTSGRFVFGRLP